MCPTHPPQRALKTTMHYNSPLRNSATRPPTPSPSIMLASVFILPSSNQSWHSESRKTAPKPLASSRQSRLCRCSVCDFLFRLVRVNPPFSSRCTFVFPSQVPHGTTSLMMRTSSRSDASDLLSDNYPYQSKQSTNLKYRSNTQRLGCPEKAATASKGRRNQLGKGRVDN